MQLKTLFERFDNHYCADAIVWRDRVYSYGWLRRRVLDWSVTLETEGVRRGAVVQLDADFSPDSVAMLLALVNRNAIVAPTTGMPELKKEEFRGIAEAEWQITFDKHDNVSWKQYDSQPSHEHLAKLKAMAHPGLVIFSSGSTGKSKAGVHDFLPLLEKFEKPRRTMRTLAFLLFDHIGGINTLFYTLFNGGTIIVPEDRTPPKVCKAIAEHKATALTTTPTFLHLMLLGSSAARHDLSSLKVINYGSEPMPESTLKRLHEYFPEVRLSQGYGLSEVGVLPTVSRASDSLFVQLKHEDGFQTRIVNGLLEIKSKSAMLGYLNAPSPFTADGWFKTGDAVEVKGDYIRILGRASEMINVGGQKVYPAEVENVLQDMPGVADVAVCGEANPILGHVVKATVTLTTPEKPIQFRRRMQEYCRTRLAGYMIPQRIVITEEALYGQRFKKMRNV